MTIFQVTINGAELRGMCVNRKQIVYSWSLIPRLLFPEWETDGRDIGGYSVHSSTQNDNLRTHPGLLNSEQQAVKMYGGYFCLRACTGWRTYTRSFHYNSFKLDCRALCGRQAEIMAEKEKGQDLHVHPGVVFPMLLIRVGADKYLCLLQSHLTRADPGVKIFPIAH